MLESSVKFILLEALRKIFGTNIRAIIPQLALSAGTMIACACESIIMGKQSSLGPIDPLLDGKPAHGIIEEFQKAYEEIKDDPNKIPLWQPIIANYDPTLIGECLKAVKWANDMVAEWLSSGMFKNYRDKNQRIGRIIMELADHSLTLSHARHISAEQCRSIGLRVEKLEENKDLQDAVLSLHHTCLHTLSATNAYKIIENHLGTAYIKQAQIVPIRG